MTARHRLCSVDDLAPGTARRFDAAGHSVALVRVAEQFYALADTCSHADFSLSEGQVDTEECTIECWKHGSLFSLLDGCPLSLPATRPVAVYEVEIVDDGVYVELAEARHG